MTKSEHERERRAFACLGDSILSTTPEQAANDLILALAERDKRFPAPEESEEK